MAIVTKETCPLLFQHVFQHYYDTVDLQQALIERANEHWRDSKENYDKDGIVEYKDLPEFEMLLKNLNEQELQDFLENLDYSYVAETRNGYGKLAGFITYVNHMG